MPRDDDDLFQPPVPEHILESVRQDERTQREAAVLRLRMLLAQWTGAKELAATPAWQQVLAGWRADLDGLRDALETQQAEAETIFLRGQIRMLRQVLQTPEVLAARFVEAEEELARLTPAQAPVSEHRETTPGLR